MSGESGRRYPEPRGGGVRRVIGRAAASRLRRATNLEPVEDVENLIEQLRQPRRVVEQIGYGAEQVAEEIARARNGGDVEDDAAQVDVQAEQVEVERPEIEMENGS